MNTEYQEQDIQLERKSPQQSEDANNQLFSICFAIVYNCIWGMLFCFFRHRYCKTIAFQSRDEEECKVMNFWSLVAEIFLFTVAIYKLAIELPVYYRALGRWKNKLFEIAEKVEFVLSIIVLIGLSYAYFQFEDCQGLRTFVLVYLIVTYLVLGIYLVSLLLLITNKSNNSG
ncbi:unnamed protein product (macronuclear) [Paramecium tetraurelia]|uniref:THH1/TOM1/TOM3 domain-containing protein n=1 Tax=Paramecium tetraurelia TaxID=5888 RepID=A0D9I5_PARTE|nr:uncharacterized protein GSPATT00014632001 [Paramecium tetraurelia]CAK79702.1 unnamed protein product [Paramecium tetraurelia]|eukprot:XP_001447099.1 hypothetical protein (macronuclear) [Paramecium tetraurelia strain d4-2]